MGNRPTSITVIGWLLITISLLSALAYLSIVLQQNTPEVQEAIRASPLPAQVQFGVMVAGIAVQFACGYAILGGKNWARVLYVVWTSLGIFGALFSAHEKLLLLPAIIMFGVIVFFLYRPDANAFFAADGTQIHASSTPSISRIASIVLYILAGFVFSPTGFLALVEVPVPILKLVLLCFWLSPAAFCLAVGYRLAPKHWKRDVGITILVATLVAAFVCFTMPEMFSNPEFTKSLPPEKVQEARESLTDYTFASIWLSAWALLGLGLAYRGWTASRSDSGDTNMPPTVGR